MMVFSEFIAQQDFKNLYLFQGDAYLAQKGIDFICQKQNIKSFDISFFNDENFDAQAMVTACEQMSFFAEKRLVVVKDLLKLTEKDKKLITEYTKKINPLCILVFIDTFKSGIFDFVSKDKVELKLLPNELNQFVYSEAKKTNHIFDKEAIFALINFCNDDLSKMVIEIKKICDFKGESENITKQDVKLLVHKDEEAGVFDLTNALGEKNVSKSLHILAQIMGGVEQNSKIFALLSTQMRRMFFIVTSKKSDIELANIFQVKPFAVTSLRRSAKNFSAKKLKDILYELEDVEYMLKNAMFSQENALYYMVTYICN